MDRETERCLIEIGAIEAELLSGNPDIAGLSLALADWSAELRILQNEKRRRAEARRRGGHEPGEDQASTQ
jgi:hypothetical protein